MEKTLHFPKLRFPWRQRAVSPEFPVQESQVSSRTLSAKEALFREAILLRNQLNAPPIEDIYDANLREFPQDHDLAICLKIFYVASLAERRRENEKLNTRIFYDAYAYSNEFNRLEEEFGFIKQAINRREE